MRARYLPQSAASTPGAASRRRARQPGLSTDGQFSVGLHRGLTPPNSDAQGGPCKDHGHIRRGLVGFQVSLAKGNSMQSCFVRKVLRWGGRLFAQFRSSSTSEDNPKPQTIKPITCALVPAQRGYPKWRHDAVRAIASGLLSCSQVKLHPEGGLSSLSPAPEIQECIPPELRRRHASLQLKSLKGTSQAQVKSPPESKAPYKSLHRAELSRSPKASICSPKLALHYAKSRL